MDRQAHEYAAAAAFAQQQAQAQAAAAAAQQQFGVGGFQQFTGVGVGVGVGAPPPPQHSQVQYLAHHQHQHYPAMQFPPYHLHQHIPPAPYQHQHQHQQQHQHIHAAPIAPHMALPHPQPPPQPQAQPFFNPWDPPPPPVPPPADADLQKRIDKLAEYAAKNGPDFEKMIREKQQDNPAYNFLFGAEGQAYYRYKLWLCTRPTSSFNHALSHSLSLPLNPPPALPPSPLNINTPPPLLGAGPVPPPHAPHFSSSFYEQQLQGEAGYYKSGDRDRDRESEKFKGLSGPLPSDVAVELHNVVTNLTGTKESIKGAKMWFMQRSPFAPALAEALRDRLFSLHDHTDRQLHIIYLANDILFDSLQRRSNPKEIDNEALAFQPVLGSMLARIYHNPQNKDANQSRLQKILQFWASKEVYDTDTIYSLEGEMLAGPPASAGPVKESSMLEPSTGPTGLPQALAQNPLQWALDAQRNSLPLAEQEKQEIPPAPATQFIGSSPQFTSTVSQPFAANIPLSFPGLLSTSTASASQPTLAQMPNLSNIRGGDQSPYPLFPPGLIPGMVRRMQIGSGVPYSPLSPVDIPTVIPPSTSSPSYILERVSKFFKEIGEVNPSESRTIASDLIEDDEREQPSRTGGACIPPPPILQVDTDTGTLPDGSIEHKPGATSTGRLGLGATADPNEVSQYDDVYSSYRKQRSSSYHTSMSARAAR